MEKGCATGNDGPHLTRLPMDFAHASFGKRGERAPKLSCSVGQRAGAPACRGAIDRARPSSPKIHKRPPEISKSAPLPIAAVGAVDRHRVRVQAWPSSGLTVDSGTSVRFDVVGDVNANLHGWIRLARHGCVDSNLRAYRNRWSRNASYRDANEKCNGRPNSWLTHARTHAERGFRSTLTFGIDTLAHQPRIR